MAISLSFLALALLIALSKIALPLIIVCAVVWPIVVLSELAERFGWARTHRVRSRAARPTAHRLHRPHLRHRWV